MSSVKVVACGVVALLVATAVAAFAQPLPPHNPPLESSWDLNKDVREDPRSLNVLPLGNQPMIDGQINPAHSPDEWRDAVRWEVWGDPNVDSTGMMSMGMGMMELLGVIQAGVYGDILYMNNDWTINNSDDPLRGTNAWRFGTSTGPGLENSGLGEWYEVLVDQDGAWARQAGEEILLQDAEWKPAEFYEIRVAAAWSGQNWQYELAMGGMVNGNHYADAGGDISPSQQEPEPGPLPYCWHWEWQQIDPRPTDGFWLPVYDGSLHHAPEPATMLLVGSGLLGLVLRRRRKK